MKWINCKDSLPEVEETVLVYAHLNIVSAYRVDNQYLNLVVPWILDYPIIGKPYLDHPPTHWMELPDKPPVLYEGEGMNHKDQEETLERISKEIFYWREWFLKKQNIPNVVRVNFLSIPSCDFVGKSPEENLIESFVAYTQNRE